jgi:hypothetical protein
MMKNKELHISASSLIDELGLAPAGHGAPANDTPSSRVDEALDVVLNRATFKKIGQCIITFLVILPLTCTATYGVAIPPPCNPAQSKEVL